MKKEECINLAEFKKIKKSKSDLILFQKKKKNESELVLTHKRSDVLFYLKLNENDEVIKSSNLTFTKLSETKFTPYEPKQDFITTGVDIFVLGCNNELVGVISLEGDGGYDRVYSVHMCAGIFFNPVRWK